MERITGQFPHLPLDEWEETKITLHLYLQIVGKIKLNLMPHRNHWWNITFHVSPRGLTSGPIPDDRGSFLIDFNFKEHLFEITTSWGPNQSFPLTNGQSVSDFYHNVLAALEDLEIQVSIAARPYDHPCKEPFGQCETYHHYNEDYVRRFWRVLISVDNIFRVFSGRYLGKVSPSQIFWHHMDLAVTRFSGRKGPEMPESAPKSDKEAYSHEVISAGFWAGDEAVRGAAFYSYTYPSPEGLENEPLQPEAAQWVETNGSPMAMLMYDDLLATENPEKELLAFLESSYQAGARRANWPEGLTY